MKWSSKRIAIVAAVVTILSISIITIIQAAASPLASTIDTATPDTIPVTPIDTPTPVLTVEQRIQKAISYTGENITFDKKSGAVVVTYYAGEQINYDSGVLLSKMYIFDMQKAIWTNGLGAVTSVEVHITSDLVNAYGKTSKGDIAKATLSKDTASQFVWDNLDQDSAWKVYDDTWLLPNNG